MSRFIPPGPAGPARSVGGLRQVRPGVVRHVAIHSTEAGGAGAFGGWPETGAPRRRPACRDSFQRGWRGRRVPLVAWDRFGPAGSVVSWSLARFAPGRGG